MLKIEQDDLKIIHRLDPRIKKIYEARMRFIVSRNVKDDTGIVDPITCWDTVAPVVFKRERIWENGKSYIQGIVPDARKMLPKVPENIWSAIEGGRAVILSRDVPNGCIAGRTVNKGQLQYAYIEGDPGTPLEFLRCTFDGCLFWFCQFVNCHFSDCDFIRSNFVGNSFLNCTISGCTFDDTVWGKLDQPEDTYNQIEGVVLNGEISYKGAKGIGAGLFMPEAAISITNEKVKQGDYSKWKGEQLRAAIESGHIESA